MGAGNTEDIVELIERRIGQEFDGECHLTEDEARKAAALIRELRGALAELVDVFAREDENTVERFDRLAEMFDRDTGYMAPGKSRPMHRCDQPDGPELHRIYDAWFAAKVSRARAALHRETKP